MLEEILDKSGACLDQVLAIVEQQEQLARAQPVGEDGHTGTAGHLLYPQHRCDRCRNERGIDQRGQIDEPRAIGKAVRDVPGDAEEVLFLHRESRTVILGDLIQINSTLAGEPLRNAWFKLLGVASPRGGVALDIRLTFTNRDLARQSLKKLLSWDFDKLIIGHGACIEKDAKPFVERAFDWLRR